LGSIIIT